MKYNKIFRERILLLFLPRPFSTSWKRNRRHFVTNELQRNRYLARTSTFCYIKHRLYRTLHIDKYVEPKIIKENEQNVHIRKYFAQKDTTDIHKSVKNLQDSYEKIKKNECKTIMTETPENIIETN